MKISTRIVSMVLALILAVSCLSICVFAAEDIKSGVAFVQASALRLRAAPSTSSKILDLAYNNEVVVVLEKTGSWYKVIYNLQEGYMHSDYLRVMTRENVELGYGRINAYRVNLRSGPSTSYSIVGKATEGTTAYIIGINNGWYKVICQDQICYVRSDLLDLTEIPYENRDSEKEPLFFRLGKSTGVTPSASALNAANAPAASGAASVSALGLKIVEEAKKYIGVPYVAYGSSPNGFDCSGYTQYVARACGVTIGRTVASQWESGTYVAKEDLQPGDILFFQNTYKQGLSHVGIYVGDGQFLHAPNSNSVVCYSDLNSSYYVAHYYGARRLG